MADETKRIIEVNGVKMEVDLRYAKHIEHIRVGAKVKVLTKKYDGHEVHPGVVIGFEPFKKLPTIIVAYVESSWSAANIKFLHYNASSKDCEIVVSVDDDALEREKILSAFDREENKIRVQLEELAAKRSYFETNFRQYWAQVEMLPQQKTESEDA